MADIHTKETRSYNMSMIKGKNTKPELIVRKHLFNCGFRYRVNVSNLPGKPDIVLRKYKAVIFVNGCFWHGHTGCKFFVMPKTREEWWRNKIKYTQNRDKENSKKLTNEGWSVITVWECQLRKENITETMGSVVENIMSGIKE